MTASQTGMLLYLTNDINDSTPAGIYVYDGSSFKNVFQLSTSEKSIVKGHLETSFSAGSSSADNLVLLPFNQETIDLKNEFDTGTHTFTAKVAGYYRIYVQASQIDFDDDAVHGIAIFLNGAPEAYSRSKHPGNLSNNTSFDGYTRSVSTITYMDAGDEINFYFNQDRAAISPDSEKTFFTIDQIR
jgi:hypothetical protein